MRGTQLLALTGLFVLAKLTGLIDFSWFQVLLPLYVWFLVTLVVWAVVTFRMTRGRGRFFHKAGRL